MNVRTNTAIFLGSMMLVLSPTALPAAGSFELKDGDRVVLIGNSLIEREQRYGYWEAALTSRWPDRNITFRNVGWSGDTVWGEARAGFDTPAYGFRRLVEHTLALKPTVIIMGYGGNEAFAGPEGLPRFKEGLKRLLEALAPAKARMVIISPLHVERLRGPKRKGTGPLKTPQSKGPVPFLLGPLNDLLPDPATLNGQRRLYRNELRAAAEAGGHRFVDLFEMSVNHSMASLTENGMHLNAAGYEVTAGWLENGLGLSGRASKLTKKQAEELRQTIIAKNQQYFYRWRPQNETYLFGFRKHEQGKNAAEIPLFDPVVEKLEKDIARLRKPVP